MWIAMECSVTVSIGEERRGVLREMRLVTGESRVTSEAAKPATQPLARPKEEEARARTDEARQHQEVIVRWCTILGRVEQSINIKAIFLRVFIFEDFQGFGIIQKTFAA